MKKEYSSQKLFNLREETVQKQYEGRGFVVLKRGLPDLFCYNPATKEFEFVEVKAKIEPRKLRSGRVMKARTGMSADQLRMHQLFKNCGIPVKIVFVD